MLFVFLVLGTGTATAARACEDQESLRRILPAASAQFVTSAKSDHCTTGTGRCCMSPSKCTCICVGTALPPGVAVGLQRASSTDLNPSLNSSGAGLTTTPDGDPPKTSSHS